MAGPENNERILRRCGNEKGDFIYQSVFGQIGGEDQADFAPAIREEKIGPALEYAKTLHAEITHTLSAR
ncbi:MAG: glycine/sarcosine/betaine reductase selenoprotein B family protein [[Clostridium] symbiosum]